jgi:hypothetical protein
MAPHAFAYRQARGVPYRLKIRGLPEFGHGNDDVRYRLVEDDKIAAALRKQNQQQDPALFRDVSAEDLDSALESASNAVDAIRNGEHDDILDLLLFAERRAFGNRVTIIEAITDRVQAVEEQRQSDSGDISSVVTPEDIAPTATWPT